MNDDVASMSRRALRQGAVHRGAGRFRLLRAVPQSAARHRHHHHHHRHQQRQLQRKRQVQRQRLGDGVDIVLGGRAWRIMLATSSYIFQTLVY